jgi:DNA-binding NarL/FixJ family response regulator
MKYQIIHADRDFRYHEKLKTAFAQYSDFHFVDHCCYLDAALQSLSIHQPQILITASKLYDETNVVEALCNYRQTMMPNLKIIVLTSKEDMGHFLNSMVEGIDGYIAKGCPVEEIHKCLSRVINGDHYLSPQHGVINHK